MGTLVASFAPRPFPDAPSPSHRVLTQASTRDDGSYVLRVELPGIASPADVSVDVLDGRAVEVTAGDSFRLAHPLPFVLADGRDGASKVKFSRKTHTLTLTFDPRATAPAPHVGASAAFPEVSVPGLSFADDPNLYLAHHPAEGRHLRARRAVRRGELLMTCPPLVHAVHDRHARWTCAGCFASLRPARGAESNPDPDVGVGGVGCDDCDGRARYCSSSCRSRDASHVAECALCLRAGDDPRLRDATRGLRLFLRLLHLRATDPDAFAPFGALRASFADADSNPSDASFRIPEKYLGMSRAINGILPPPARVPERELASILAAAHANLHGVVDAEGRHLGSGVYVPASMFNHSCAPEAVVSFGPGGVLRAHAVEDVSAGAPIRIAYSELYASPRSRRDALRAKKGFECACRRCVDVDGKWTRRDAALDGWACADATCDGSVPPPPRDGSIPTDATCDACGTTRSDPPSPTRTRAWADAADAARERFARGDVRAAAEIARGALGDSAGRLHERHVIRHELRLVAADAAFAAGEWSDAAEAARDALAAMRATLSEYHPGSARVATLLGNALTRLAEAEAEAEVGDAGARGGSARVPVAASSDRGSQVRSGGTRVKHLADAAVAYGFAAEALGISYGEDHAETVDARAREATARLEVMGGSIPQTEGSSSY